MPNQFIYPIYTGVLSLLAFVLLPRKEIRRLAIYAIVFGGLFDVLAILFFTKFLGMGGYINFKNFGAFGIPIFPPIAWVAYYIMFLYILPRNKPWNYIFPVVAGCFSLYFSYVLQALGIFRWNYGSPILHLFAVYLPWECAVAWVYLRLTNEDTNKQRVPRRYFTVPAPAMKPEKQKVRLVRTKKL